MMDFIIAALPWVLIGVSVAVALVVLSRCMKEKKDIDEVKEKSTIKKKDLQEDEETNGLALGICIGVSMGTSFGLLFDNLALGMSMGLLWGVVLGNLYNSKKK